MIPLNPNQKIEITVFFVPANNPDGTPGIQLGVGGTLKEESSLVGVEPKVRQLETLEIVHQLYSALESLMAGVWSDNCALKAALDEAKGQIASPPICRN